MTDTQKLTKVTEPGEFETESAVMLENGNDEAEFDNGVSAAFLRFDNQDNQEANDD